MLSEKSQTINSLAGHFDMSRPAVSKHVKIMHLAGFISIEDIGRERHCTLKQDGFNELNQWMEYYDNFWKHKLNRLGLLMNANKNKQ